MERLIHAGDIKPGDKLKVLRDGQPHWHYVADANTDGEIVRVYSGQTVLNRHARELVTIQEGV